MGKKTTFPRVKIFQALFFFPHWSLFKLESIFRFFVGQCWTGGSSMEGRVCHLCLCRCFPSFSCHHLQNQIHSKTFQTDNSIKRNYTQQIIAHLNLLWEHQISEWGRMRNSVSFITLSMQCMNINILIWNFSLEILLFEVRRNRGIDFYL